MSQSRRSRATASTSPYSWHLYREARKRVFQLRDSLGDVTDATSAHSWISSFGKSMRRLSVSGKAVGIDPAEEMEVRAFLGDARNATINFATAEWIDLSPDLVIGLEESLHDLAPGEMLGKAFPPRPSASSRASRRSGLPAPPTSHTPSSGSASPRPASAAAAGGSGDRAVRSLPRARAPEPSPVAAASAPTAVAAARRTLRVSGQGKRPAGWVRCERCKSRHNRCAPPSAVKPPYGSCYSCLKDEVECVPARKASGPSHKRRRRQVAASPVSAPEPSPPPAGPLSEGSDDDDDDDDDQSTDAPPAVPLHGTASAPLSDLLDWRAEVCAAEIERESARNAQLVAVLRLKAADKRLRVARRNYLELEGRVVAAEKEKRKRKRKGGGARLSRLRGTA